MTTSDTQKNSVHEVADADADTVDLVCVARSDAVLCCADLAAALAGFFGFMDKETFAEKLKYNVEQKNLLLEKLYGMEGFDYETMLNDYLGYAEKLRPYVKDTN